MTQAEQPSPTPPGTSIVERLTNISIVSTDGRALYSLLADDFKLPIAWPFEEYFTDDFGSFYSGAVAIGKVKLEICQLKYGRQYLPPASERLPQQALFGEISFRASGPFSALPQELTARGVSNRRHVLADNFRAWSMTDLLDQPQAVYCAEFDLAMGVWGKIGQPTDSDWLKKTLSNADKKRLRFLGGFELDELLWYELLQRELDRREGGALGLNGRGEVRLSCTDIDASIKKWRRIVGDQLDEDGFRLPDDDMAVRFVSGPKNAIAELRLTVRSAARAREVLQAHGILGTGDGPVLEIHPTATHGTRITLQETSE